MSLVQTYLDNNGYDYYGNAAEDTLVFFVRDEEAPSAQQSNIQNNEALAGLPGDAIKATNNALSSNATAIKY